MDDSEVMEGNATVDMTPERIVMISLYSVSRHYGGPEEGGWWYDRSEFIEVVARDVSMRYAPVMVKALNDEANEERKKDGRPQGRYSVLGGEDAVYRLEDVQGEHEDINDSRPHYE